MGNINQIESIIYKLNRKPNSRRAQAITWMPRIDINSDNPPCLQRIQCLIRDGKLHMDVNFRSNDCLSAFGQNAYALTFLQKMIADELGVPVGRYTHYITSAHIYFERDAEELKRLKEVMYYG
jgi:thymidylate synthase